MKKKYLITGGIAVLLILMICLFGIYEGRENLKAYQEEYVAMKELPGR